MSHHILVLILTALSTRAVAAPVSWGPLQATVFSPTLIRLLEASPRTGAHESRASLAMVATTSNFTDFLVSADGDTLTIKTSAVTLSYTHPGGNVTSPPIASVCALARRADVADGNRVAEYPDGAIAPTQASCCALCDSTASCTAWIFAPSPSSTAAAAPSTSPAPRRATAAAAAATLADPPGTNCWLLMGVTQMNPSSTRIAGALLPWANDTLSATFALSVADGTRGSWDSSMRSEDDAGQLRGVWHANDCYDTPASCIAGYVQDQRPGLLSRSGWFLLDDTASARRVPNDPASPSPLTAWFTNATADGPAADWYFFAPGLDYATALRDFVAVSGAPALPPRSVYGVWWSHWEAFNQTFFTSDILGHYASLSLPLDHVVLDVDWHTELSNVSTTPCYDYGGWTVNTALWPAWDSFVASLHDGTNPTGHPLRLLLNLHLQGGYDACQKYYTDFAQAVGASTAPGAPIVPCTTGNQRIAAAIFSAYMDHAELAGVDAWWTDNDGTECFGAPSASTPSSFPAMAWSNEVFAGHNAVRGRRPLVLSRSGGLGAHRSAVSFSGDANQHREILRWEIWITPRAVGAMHHTWSHDVGGFMCNSINQTECSGDPTLDSNGLLYLRWLQAAVTWPVLRTHASEWGLAVMERRVWHFPAFFAAMADALRLRSALLPYTYSEAARASATGLGYVRPLFVEWPLSDEAYAPLESPIGTQYLFGGALLASPIWATNETMTAEGGVRGGWKSTWLPPGVTWSTWNATDALVDGGVTVDRFYSLGDTPLFVRAGSVVPMMTFASVSAPAPDPLVIAVFPAFGAAVAATNYSLFEDDGESQSSAHTVTLLTARFDRGGAGGAGALGMTNVTISASQGTWAGAPAARALHVHVRGFGAGVASVTVAGAAVPAGAPGCAGACWFVVSEAAHTLLVPAGTLVVEGGRWATESDVEFSIART